MRKAAQMKEPSKKRSKRGEKSKEEGRRKKEEGSERGKCGV